MNKLNFLSKLAIAGIAGTISTINITMTPAQASNLNIGSDLTWSGGWSPALIPQIDPIDDDEIIQFTLNGSATIEQTSGDFAVWLPLGIGQTEPVEFDFTGNVSQLEVTWQQVTGEDILPGTPAALAVYQLQEDVVFDFTDEFVGEILPKFLPDEEIEVTEIKYVIPAGVQYLLDEFIPGEFADLSICGTTCARVPFWMVNGKNDPAFSNHGFSEIIAAGQRNASYDSETIVVAKAPEPGTILGLLAISGLGLGLKRKKQS